MKMDMNLNSLTSVYAHSDTFGGIPKIDKFWKDIYLNA